MDFSKELQEENKNTIATTQEEILTYQDYVDAVENAQKALKEFMPRLFFHVFSRLYTVRLDKILKLPKILKEMMK